MRFWCSAQTVAWSWAWQPYLGVWLLVLLLGLAYYGLRSRFPPTADAGEAGERARRGRYFAVGLLCLWIALDWPVGALGAGYLASVHMLQYLLIALVAPALMLLGLPREVFARLGERKELIERMRLLVHPVVAFFIFNVIISITHWPEVVDLFMTSQLGSFVIDISWLAVGFIFWWSVIAPVPDWPRFRPLFKMGYLGLNGIMIRPPFLILLFSKYPAYASYELAPPIAGIDPLGDQQFAAGVMKLGTAWIMVVAMAFVFFTWVGVEKRKK